MEHVRSRQVDGSNLFHAIAAFVIAVPVLFVLVASVLELFGRSVAEGLAAVLALYFVGLSAWLTARELARPA